MSSPLTPLDPSQTALQEAQAAHEDFVRRVAALEAWLAVAALVVALEEASGEVNSK